MKKIKHKGPVIISTLPLFLINVLLTITYRGTGTAHTHPAGVTTQLLYSLGISSHNRFHCQCDFYLLDISLNTDGVIIP